MMLRREPTIQFDSFAQIQSDPRRKDLVTFLSGGSSEQAAGTMWNTLANDPKQQAALACLVNITTALEQMRLLQIPGTNSLPLFDANPLKAFKQLDRPPEQDRIFAWADVRLVDQVKATAARNNEGGLTRFASAPAALHPGATGSWKQIDFGEGNVQFSFHPETQQIGGMTCSLVEVDVDYFKDPAAHLLLEVFPNSLKGKIHGKDAAESLTDPHKVYGLRWTAGRRLAREFSPPYVLQ